MGNNVKVNLQFTADTNQAKQQLQSLQQTLTSLINKPVGIGDKITSEIQQATNAAAELKVHLESATNVNTGALDFGKLTNALKKSGLTLSDYGAKLQRLGPQGQQAFMQLAKSVASAEVPLKRTSATMDDLLVSLKNTAKWQLSSSLMHGLIGGVQKAYGYAQDLNESLNNIRIVTGQSIDQMAKFAEEANKAARALSTTTTEYTNASLIYYQQGLNDQQVKERTDITIKMANVARQSAEVVSDQMTAVWNNFYDGSKSLEHYADVMTALGAATASSTDEIAEGLNKFAAVADTVGLSYEYAASALATVTATTRQSADVVGTAFKTLFARIQDLELGKTLDDGTTLGSYSQALAKVGVQIKDTSGEMKSMDAILEEMAAKWDTLGKAEQIALAQSVAGVRQYTQLIALMDNWDFMEQNLATSNASSGALQKQADIYAESWEAANKRVKASSEALYSSLLNDELFIDLTNIFADLIDMITQFVDNIGGLGGILTTLGVICTKVFDKQIAQGFRNIAYNIKMSTEAGRLAVQQQKEQEMDNLAKQMAANSASGLEEETAQKVYTQELQLQTELIGKAEKMSEAEARKFSILLDQQRAYGQQSIEIARQIELLKERSASASIEIMGTGMNNGASIKKMADAIAEAKQKGEGLGAIEYILQEIGQTGQATSNHIDRLKNIIKASAGTDDDLKSLAVAFEQLETNGKEATSAMEQIRAVMFKLNTITIKDVLKTAEVKEGTEEYERLSNILRGYMSTVSQTYVENRRLQTANQNLKNSFTTLKQEIANAGISMKDWASHLTGFVSGLSSIGMLISSFSSLMNTIQNPDATGWEKFGAVLTSVSMIMMGLSGSWKGLVSLAKLSKEVINGETFARLANALAAVLQKEASEDVAEAKDREEQETRENADAINKETAAKVANKAADKIEFKGQHGKTRTYSGKKNHRGELLDDNGQRIGKKFVDKYKLNDFGKKPSGTTTPKTSTPKATPKAGWKGTIKPGTLKTLGSAAAGAAIVAASVAIAAVAISKASEYYHRHETAALSAAEAANRLAESYNKVKEAETTFRDNISGYENAKEGLDQLIKGTTEYKQAVMDANAKALELLKTNKDLSYTINKDTGLIEIDKEQLAKAEEESLHKEKMAQYASLAANQNAKNKRLEADRIQFTREQAKSGTQTWDNDDATVATGAGIAVGALGIGGGLLAAGAVNGWNPVGWVLLAAGALTGLVGGAMMLFSNDAQELEQEALDAIAKKRQELGEDLSAEQIKEIALKYDDTGKLGESLAGTTEALNNTNDMAEAINENTAALRANSELILSQEYGSAAAEWLVDTYDSKYNSKKAELEKLNKNINRAEDLDEGSEASQFIAQYEALTGKQMDWDYHVAANGDDEREFIYYETNPETGEKEEKRMNYQDMIEEMAVAYAMAEQSEEAAKVRNMLTNIEATQGINTANALASWTTTGELGDGITLSNFDNLQSSIDAAGGTEAYLEQTYGKDINEIAKELGYGSATLLLESFDTAMADKQAEFQDAMEKIPDAMQESFKVFTDKNVALGELTAQEYSAITTPLQEAFVKGGETGYKMVEGLLDSADTGAEMTALGEALSGIDWEKATPDSLREKLDELGVSTEMTTIELEALIGVMIDGVIKVSQIGQEYASLLNALQSGDSINYDQYLQMVERGLGSYFTYMYDGTYKLIDAATGFGDILKDITQNDYRENMAQAETRLSEIQTEVSTKTAALNALGDDVINKATGSTDLLLANYTQGKVSMGSDGVAKHNYTDWVTTEKEYSRTVKNYGLFGIDWLAADSKITGTETVVEELKRSKEVSQAAVDTYNARIDYIEALGIVSDEMIESWRTSEDMVATEKLIVETYLPQAIQAHEELATLEAKQRLEMFKMEQALASTATTFTELQGLKDSGDIGTEAWWQAYEAMSNQEDMEGLEASAVQEYSNYLASANIESNVFSDELQGNAEAAKEVAKDIMKLNNGIDKLASNFEDWNDVLEKSDEGSQEYAEAMNGVRDAMSDVLGISEEYIDNDYIVENLEDIEKAAEGDAEAIDRLKAAMAENIICKITAVDNFSELDTNIQTLHNKLLDLNTNIEVGASLNIGDFITAANDLITKTGMTVDQAQAYFNSLGYEPTFVTEKKTVPLEGTRTYTENVVIGTKALDQGGAEVPFQYIASSDTRTEAIPMGSQEIEVPALSADGTPKIKSLTKSSAGSANNYSKVNSGGPKINNTKTSDAKAKKSDLVDRYKEINDKIDDSTRTMDRASKAADRLYGPARLKQMEKINKALKEEIGHLKDKRSEAELYLEEDKTALGKALDGMGMGLQFTLDENGNISNYEDVMTQIHNKRESLLKSFGATMDDEEQKRLDDFDNKADELKDAISQYDETRELLEDIDDQIDDKWNEWQDNNYEQLHYKLELEIEIDDRELAWLEHQLNQIADDFYKMGESAALTSRQLNVYADGFETDNGFFNQLQAQYNTFNADGVRSISQADYIAGMQEVYDGAIADAEAIRELDKTMLDYYGNTLSMAGEELAKYTDRMEHQTSILEHYRNIMDIIGEPTNYEAIGTILEGQSKTIENEMEVSKKNYEMLSEEAKKKKQLLTDALARGDAEAAEVYQREWEAAEAAAREAQETMLSKTEEWAEAMKAVLENKLAGLAQTLENALTGGTSFDTLSTQMERAASLQEEYLTTTNKIYETNKMINIAQQAIDKTTNTVAKQRLKDFQQETVQLQNKSKLSQYELDIQQAKYDLLLAEIALEEAQSAKSTVRLQRDSEGNFGYVYTADANKVSDAEQKVADAQNALYNKGLEGANDYTQKYQETMQEMYDTLTDLQTRYLNGEFETEEEYHQAMEEAKAYYYQQLQNYSSLYQVATTTDSRVIADAWSSDFADMTYNTETWKSNVEDYLSNVNSAFDEWKTTVAKLKNETVGNDLTELKTKVEDIVTESDNLTTALTKEGGVIDEMQNVITKVSSATSAWAAQRKEILDLTTAYDNLALAAKGVLDTTIPEEEDGDNTTNSNGGVVGSGYNNEEFSSDEVKEAQTWLNSQGAGLAVDGKWGPKSQAAAKARGYSSLGSVMTANIFGNAASMDTGGYTGSWGQEGKFAMLHEKELILNADDTANFLSSLDILHDIVNTINLHSMNAQLGGLLNSPGYIDTNNSQVLEQQVTIEASFPGVTERNEIEEAFNNLINRASQFVNRK